MAEIIFVEHDGTEHRVSLVANTNLMQLAIDNGIPGIDGDCGGSCACGTCHIQLSSDDFARIGSPDEAESAMLEIAPECVPESRLACQIASHQALDGMVVRLPEHQI